MFHLVRAFFCVLGALAALGRLLYRREREIDIEGKGKMG